MELQNFIFPFISLSFLSLIECIYLVFELQNLFIQLISPLFAFLEFLHFGSDLRRLLVNEFIISHCLHRLADELTGLGEAVTVLLCGSSNCLIYVLNLVFELAGLLLFN